MGRGRKKTSNKSTPYLNLKGLKTKSYEPENYENINPEDLSDDEIDAFIKANEDKISLKGTKYDREDDGNRGLSYDNDIVMDLPDDIYDDDDDDDDDDDTNRYGKKQSLKDAAIEAVNRRREQERAMNPEEDEDEETLEDALERDQAVGGWGHKKASYYEEHSSERSSALTPSQASRSEELEARRLQKMHNSAIDEEDFAGTLSATVTESDEREKGQSKISVEREMVEEISKDLNDISILGDRSGMERIEKRLEGLSDEEKLGILQQNSPELIALVNEFKSSLASIKTHYAPAMKLIDKLDVKSKDLNEFCNFIKIKFRKY